MTGHLRPILYTHTTLPSPSDCLPIDLNDVLFLSSLQFLFKVSAVVYCSHRSAITIFIAPSLPYMYVCGERERGRQAERERERRQSEGLDGVVWVYKIGLK